MRCRLSRLRNVATWVAFSGVLALMMIASNMHAQTTFQKRVATGNDDAEEDSSDGDMYLDSSDLELAQTPEGEDAIGVRFTSITVPQGATITDAYIQFTCDETSSGSMSLTIRGHDTDDADGFTSSDYNISSRSKTSASVAWSPPAWSSSGDAGADQRTSDLTSIVQEIVNRSGWSSGNDMAFIITGTGTRTAESYNGSSSQAPLLSITYTTGGGGGGSSSDKIFLSTTGGATLGGVSFDDEDIVEYDPDDDTSVLRFDGSSVFAGGEDVDAIHVQDNGKILLSTKDSATIGSLNFNDEDIVEYDPSTGTATLYFDGSAVFSGNEDVDAVCLLDSGNLVLSTTGSASIGGLSFSDEDLVEYDPSTGSVTLLLDGSAVIADESGNDFDLVAAHVLSDGTIFLSMSNDSSIGALNFGDDDIVKYDPGTGTATLYFDGGANFSSTGEDVDALSLELAIATTPSGFWKLDETTGTTAVDSSSNGHDGTLQGGFSFDFDSIAGCGAITRGLRFDGSNDHIIVAGNSGVTGAAARTVAAWIKTDATGSIVAWGTEDAGELWIFRVQDTYGPAGTIAVEVNGGYVVGTTSVTDDRWHHVVAVLPAGSSNVDEVLLYVDGVLETIGASQSQSIDTVADSDVVIGTDPQSRYFDGVLANVILSDAEYTHAQISALYGLVGYWKLDETSGTNAEDSSGNSKDGTTSGGQTFDANSVSPGKIDNALDFDGSSHHVDLPDINSDFSGGISIAMWIKPEQLSFSYSAPLGISNGQNVDDIWYGLYPLSGMEIYLSDPVDGSSNRYLDDNLPLVAGLWQHCVVSIDASGMATMYRDGVEINTGFVSLPRNVGRSENFIGTSVWNDEFDGAIDDVRLYNRPLCADEVSGLVENGKTKLGLRIIKWVEVK